MGPLPGGAPMTPDGTRCPNTTTTTTSTTTTTAATTTTTTAATTTTTTTNNDNNNNNNPKMRPIFVIPASVNKNTASGNNIHNHNKHFMIIL